MSGAGEGGTLRIPFRGSASRRNSGDSSYEATVLERKDGSLTLQRDGGEVVILSLDDPGLNLHVDRDVVKGSRVEVSEEKSTNAKSSRTVDVKLAAASAK